MARLFEKTVPFTAEEVATIRTEAAEDLTIRSLELEALLRGRCPLELIGSLSAAHMMIDSETFKEYSHDGDPFVVELVTLLLLKRPYGYDPDVEPSRLNEINEMARMIKFATFFFHALEFRSGHNGGPSDPTSAFESLQVSSASSDLFVRAPGYAHNLERDLLEIFKVSNPYLKNELGFGVDDVISVDHAFERLLGKRENEVRRAKNTWLRETRWAEERSAKLTEDDDGTEAAPKFTRELLKVLRGKGPSARRRALKRHADLWAERATGRAHIFDCSSLAKESGISEAAAAAIVSFFSIEFGTQEESFSIFDTPHVLFERPLVRHKENFVYPVPGTILWAVRDRLEAVLNPDREPRALGSINIWSKYDDSRATYLEQGALQLLGSTLTGSECYRGLKYKMVVDDKVCEFELDGLLVYDQTLILVEAKAGAMSRPGRRGRARRMKGDLRKIVAEALEQGIRTQNFINGAEEPCFVTDSGDNLKLDKSRFVRTVLVTVSLEPLDALFGSFHDFIRSGVVSGAVIPWPVSLGSLRVICEMVEFPTQLLDYVYRRVNAIELEKIRAMDELDWFAAYLKDGLRPEKDGEVAAVDMVMLDTAGSSLFDDFYNHKLGRRKKPAPKPRQEIPKLMKEIIFELDSQLELLGRSEAIISLLDWSGEAREKIASLFWRIRSRAVQDGGLHDASLVVNEQAGVTFFAVTDSSLQEGIKKLPGYVEFKKYEAKSRRWVGFLSNVDEQRLLHSVVVCDFEWAFNEEAERILKRLEKR